MATSKWTKETDEKIHYTKLCRLLYDGGTLAVKTVFDKRVPPVYLTSTLTADKHILLKLKKPKGKVLSQDQWDLLYPPSGACPKSEDFDITLLFVLLRNICGLTPPATGWDASPTTTDTSLEANLARIKYYRNKVIAHSSKAEVGGPDFETYWNNISGALVALGLKQGDIDRLKDTPLGKKDYNQLLKECDLSDQEIKSQLEGLKSQITTDTANIRSDIADLKGCVETVNSQISRLAHRDFASFIERLCQKYHPKTREWLMNDVKSRVRLDDGRAGTEVIQAGPGMGKSVVAAKLCQEYKNQGILGGCHFFKHDNTLLNNPRIMLQSVARQLCDLYPEYCNMLNRSLSKNLGKDMSELTCEEWFTLLFEEPCCNLNPDGYFVIVIDALDECCNSLKRELFKTLRQIYTLPPWLRFILTTRPPPSISSLHNLGAHIYIDPIGYNNTGDIQMYITDMLQEIGHTAVNYDDNQISQLVEITKGIFLVAYFIVDLLRNSHINSISEAVKKFPKGITSVYEDYFTRLQNELMPQMHSEEGFYDMLEAVAAAKYPIEKTMFYSILGLKDEPRGPTRRERKEAINHLHQLFPVEHDHVSAFHKTVIDWLTTEDHDFSVKGVGCNLLADKYYDALHAMKLSLKQSMKCQTPYSITDGDNYALKAAPVYFEESKSFSEERKSEMQSDPELLYLRVLVGRSLSKERDSMRERDNGGGLYHYSRDCQKIINTLEKFFQHRVVPAVWWYTPPSFEQLLQLTYQAAYLLKIGNTEKTLRYLNENSIPYVEKEVSEVDCTKHIRQVVGYNSGLLLVEHVKKTTKVSKYQLDGILIKEMSFDGHKELYMSPNNQLIVAIPLSGKRDIEVIDTVSLVVKYRYNCPNVVKSCHVFGHQPWYIMLRCHNNMIYIMEGETGLLVRVPTTVQQNDDILGVSKEGLVLLARTSVLSKNKFGYIRENTFTDDSGYWCSQIFWNIDTHNSIGSIQESFISNFKNLDDKLPIYARHPYGCQCSGYSPYRQHGDDRNGQYLFRFSEDGQLLAFYYDWCITIVHTYDGSLYKTVCLSCFSISLKGILFLSKEQMVVEGDDYKCEIIYFRFGTKKDEILLDHIFYMPSGFSSDRVVILKEGHIRSVIFSEHRPENVDYKWRDKKISIYKYNFLNFPPQPSSVKQICTIQ